MDSHTLSFGLLKGLSMIPDRRHLQPLKTTSSSSQQQKQETLQNDIVSTGARWSPASAPPNFRERQQTDPQSVTAIQHANFRLEGPNSPSRRTLDHLNSRSKHLRRCNQHTSHLPLWNLSISVTANVPQSTAPSPTVTSPSYSRVSKSPLLRP